MTTKKHIAIVCSRLDLPGGIERAIVNTANLLQSKNHKVTVIIADITDRTFYALHNDIHLLQIDLNFGITSQGNMLTRKLDFFRHIKKLERIFIDMQPQVILGTEYSLSIVSYLAGKKTGAKIFAWEHHHFHWLKKSRFWNYLYKKVYPKLTSIICLNETERNLFQKFGCRATVIPNFVNQQKKTSTGHKTILSIGWLIYRKGFDLTPKIAQKVFEKYPDWKWTIIGSGEEETSLRKEILNKNLQNHLSIVPPVSSDLENTYSRTAIYVMTSRFECFPMVLLEAMSHGVPTIAFDSPTGPAFIINNEVDGLLIEQNNSNAMAAAIIDLIANKEKRKAYGDAAYQNMLRFSPDKVNALWQALFDQNSSEPISE